MGMWYMLKGRKMKSNNNLLFITIICLPFIPFMFLFFLLKEVFKRILL